MGIFRRYGDVEKAYEFSSYLATLCFTNKIYADLSISWSLEGIVYKKLMYLSKLETQLVTSTLSEKFLYRDSGVQNQKFDFGII
jgi:hypothetical protein